jgi:hypothetical protein
MIGATSRVRKRGGAKALKNIQIIDRAENATFSVFQATEEEFAAIFLLMAKKSS